MSVDRPGLVKRDGQTASVATPTTVRVTDPEKYGASSSRPRDHVGPGVQSLEPPYSTKCDSESCVVTTFQCMCVCVCVSGTYLRKDQGDLRPLLQSYPTTFQINVPGVTRKPPRVIFRVTSTSTEGSDSRVSVPVYYQQETEGLHSPQSTLWSLERS